MTSDAATLTGLLERAARMPDEGLRLLDRTERARWLSWAEIFERALEVGGALQKLGVDPGDRVAIVFPTDREFFYAFFGVLLAGAVPVPLYPPVRLGRLEQYHQRTAGQLAAVGARLVLCDRWTRRVFGPTVSSARPELGCLRLDELPEARLRAGGPEAKGLALVQFSSGTTSDPKPVALSHRALLAQVRTLNSFWPDTAECRQGGVSWLPLYHDMGLIGCVLPALERPGPLTLIPPELFVARPAVWLRTVSRYRATISPAPNFAYGLCVQKIRDEEMQDVDLSCWRVALNGAEAVAPRVLAGFRDRFARWGFRPEALTPVYGLSEAALAVTFSDLGSAFVSRRFDREGLQEDGAARESREGLELVSVGRPLPGFTIRIVNGSNETMADGQVGRILVRGPSLMEGYFGRPTATAAVLREGWLDTGDLGFRHQGELYLTGRHKDLLIVRGRNHAPEEIEHPLDHVPGVRRGCTVAVSWWPEGASAEQLLVLVEARRELPADEYDRLAVLCSQEILAATGLATDRLLILPPGTLPRTSSGKLRRREALRLFEKDELEPPKPVTALHLARALTRSVVHYASWRRERRGRE